MWRETVCAAALVVLMLFSGRAQAVDPQSTQAYCDAVKEAAKAAEKRYVVTFKPRQDPGKTFDDATMSCLDGILSYPSAFQFTLPTMAAVQEILRQMAKRLMLQACQAAHDQFDRAVQDAMDTVDGVVDTVNDNGQLPGDLGGIHVGGYTSVPIAGARAPAAAAPAKTESTWDAVVNFFSGRGDKR